MELKEQNKNGHKKHEKTLVTTDKTDGANVCAILQSKRFICKTSNLGF